MRVARTPELTAVARVVLLVSLAVVALLALGTARAYATTYDPNLVIANDQLRHYDSMSLAQIQAFLDSKPGVLKSLETTDHAGVKKKASKIIYEACRAYHLNPKVMLALLQKEQSLITRTKLEKNTLSRAVGAGCPDSTTNKYPGFGKQIWNGARLLDGYGEGKTTSYIAMWRPGIKYDVYDGSYVTPKNIATYKLYVYNPSIGVASKYYDDVDSRGDLLSGNASFWHIYNEWFGNPKYGLSLRPVYRFRDKHTGSFVMTSSQWERYTKIIAPGSFTYQGAKFKWDTKDSTNSLPVYRFKSIAKGTRYYTSNATTYKKMRAAASTWKYEGIAFKVRKTSTGGTPIYKFRVKANGTYTYTSLRTEVRTMRSASGRKLYDYMGIVWRIAQ